MKKQQPNGIRRLANDLRQKQRNVLPPDVIRNDRDINDALWNGSANSPFVQRAGAFVIGATLFLGGLATGSIAYERRSWVALMPISAITVAGLRVAFKSLRHRATGKA
jgi:hypothetical protein